ncbi:MAG: hypothetical protein ACJAVI_000705 [Candidatus Azotimanducaceae bacterium]|jgi:hypothetical protein
MSESTQKPTSKSDSNKDMNPSPLYGTGARALQDEFDSRRLADRLVDLTLHSELTEEDITLISLQSTVWLATVDEAGWPDVSYKGGVTGFVSIKSSTELRLPIFDGNGMFRTLGNLKDNGKIALLFLDNGRPWRIRIHGTAVVSTLPADCEEFDGAIGTVIVSILRIFPNCGRYIHTQSSESEISAFVPQPGHQPPAPEWKSHPAIKDSLPR